MKIDLDSLTPKQIVAELDKYIVGQTKAKKAVAIALRNRTRRQRLSEEMRDEVAPKNIIMIGPTGVGKTEIARRLSRLCGAPFVKVEATKYTEVGYVGRDVESMIRDLMSTAVSMVKVELQDQVREEAQKRAEEALLDLLLPGIGKSPPRSMSTDSGATRGVSLGSVTAAAAQPPADAQSPAGVPPGATTERPAASSTTREKFRQKLRNGELEDKTVEVNVTSNQFPAIEIFSGTSLEEMDVNIGNLGNIFGGRKKRKKTTVARAREILLAEEMDKLIDMERVTEQAINRVEQMGIVFIDELDKIASRQNVSGVDVSREGVQRDILPIVEGSKVHTRYGMVDTAHILFIAAGAFHMSKPSDLIPELQGRFPLRVELQALTSDDFVEILTQPRNALIKQYVELLRTEKVELVFDEKAIRQIAEIASQVNSKTENIGARRLHTIMESLLEEVSFNASDIEGQTVTITDEYVNDRLRDIVEDQDLSRFIL
jgi:ATP-dependent HslUV protease ATP-binding subunit HslU